MSRNKQRNPYDNNKFVNHNYNNIKLSRFTVEVPRLHKYLSVITENNAEHASV